MGEEYDRVLAIGANRLVKDRQCLHEPLAVRLTYWCRTPLQSGTQDVRHAQAGLLPEYFQFSG